MEIDNMKTLVDAAREGVPAKDRIVDVAGVPTLITRDNAMVLKPILEIADARAEAPQRRKGTASHAELESFILHVNRFKDDDSAVFADISSVRLTAVLDYHKAGKIADGGQRWGEHRSIYQCPVSKQWKKWHDAADDAMSQDGFAQFIDDNLGDVVAGDGFPAPSDLLTMARNLVINSKGTFSRSVNPTTAEASLVCKTEHESTSTKIPRAFLLGIPVFEAGTVYRVEARLRMQIQGSAPMFSFSLYRADLILADAFNAVRLGVAKETGLPVFAGSPE